uniref:Uncharacterized protein n=1 Tax=Rhizophora mucronata TaxID=61149 RepID=A0A2P2N933_RHIMU
MVWKERELI